MTVSYDEQASGIEEVAAEIAGIIRSFDEQITATDENFDKIAKLQNSFNTLEVMVQYSRAAININGVKMHELIEGA